MNTWTQQKFRVVTVNMEEKQRRADTDFSQGTAKFCFLHSFNEL